MANVMSSNGTPRMNSGMNSGAKKKNDWPEKGASVRPPTETVDAAINRPSNMEPPSPIMIRAG